MLRSPSTSTFHRPANFMSRMALWFSRAPNTLPEGLRHALNTPKSATIPPPPCASSLPFEVLSNIFTFAMAVWPRQCIQLDHQPVNTLEKFIDEDQLRNLEDVRSRRLLPHALIDVCHSWRNVLSCDPTLWTNIRIILDSDPTPLSDIPLFLSWSRGLPLNVFIGRRNFMPAAYDVNERERLASVLTILQPHFHRIGSLFIFVNQASSLTSQCWQPYNTATRMRDLILHCNLDDNAFTYLSHRVPVKMAYNCFSSLTLTTMELDGPSFMRIWGNQHSAPSDFPSLECLTISHLSPTVTLVEHLALKSALWYITGLKSLQKLHLIDIHFLRSGLRLASDPLLKFRALQELSMTDIDGCTVPQILMWLDRELRLQVLAIKSSEIDTMSITRWLITNQLIMKDFPTGGMNICLPFRWIGSKLVVSGCQEFDDNILGKMEETAPIDNCSSRFIYLYIVDCPSFSPKALRKFVQLRKAIALRPQKGQVVALPIQEVVVTGVGPIISAEDAVWFSANVPKFCWVTTQIPKVDAKIFNLPAKPQPVGKYPQSLKKYDILKVGSTADPVTTLITV